MLQKVIFGILTVLVALSAIKVYNIVYHEYIPNIDEGFWYGPERLVGGNFEGIRTFEIRLTENEIDDLYQRLNNSRGFTASPINCKGQFGTTATVMTNLTKYLKEQYNIQKRMEFLNTYPQYKTLIQGLDIHFIHVKPQIKQQKPENKNRVYPILLLHGWPSSVREFYEFIPNMTTVQPGMDFVFELVIPSLPGFGYSDASVKPDCKGPHIAAIMRTLMRRLGHKKFLVHGSDWGGIIGSQMATIYPDSVLGYHSNFCFSLRPITFGKLLLGALFPSLVIDSANKSKMYPLMEHYRFYLYESAYLHLMGTKPDTLGHGLDNSPEGLISFLIEKLSIGTNKQNAYLEDGGLSVFNLETIMDNILFYYWFPRKATTAAHIYAENLRADGLYQGVYNTPINEKVPCGCAYFENEFIYQPEWFLTDKFTNLVHYKYYNRGGHFTALELPDLLLSDIMAFVSKISINLM